MTPLSFISFQNPTKIKIYKKWNYRPTVQKESKLAWQSMQGQQTNTLVVETTKTGSFDIQELPPQSIFVGVAKFEASF